MARTAVKPAGGTWLSIMDAGVAGILFLVSLVSFAYTDLSAYLSANLDFFPGGVYLVILGLLTIAVAAGIFAGNGARNVIVLSWALFVPSVLYFTRFDLLALFVPGGFELLSSHLPAVFILAAGMLLTSGTIAHGSLAEMRDIRSSFVSRGADAAEVDGAVGKNLLMIAAILAISLALAVGTALASTLVTPYIAGLLIGGFWHLAFVTVGTAIISVVIVVHLWPKRGG